MESLIIIVVVLVVLWSGRSYLKGWAIAMVHKIKGVPLDEESMPKKKGKSTTIDGVHAPVGLIRYFDITLGIEEMGSGNVKISVVKSGKKSVE